MSRWISRHWLALFRVCVLFALAASSALYVHYIDPADSAFCGGKSACEAVRRSGFSYFGSRFINIPLIGIAAYLAVFATSFGEGASQRRRLALRWMAGIGGVVALSLVLVQGLVLSAFCWLCLLVDGFAVAAAFLVVSAPAESPRRELLVGWAWWLICGLLIAGPIAYSEVKPNEPVPPRIAELYKPGKLNVVEFADFQCPFCRRLHPTLKELNAEFGEAVHFQRLQMPLPSHEYAESAARAQICAAAAGKGEAMADLLFEEELAEESGLEHALTLDLDQAKFTSCLHSDQTSQVLHADIARLKASGFRGLPTTYIGEKRIIGARDTAYLRGVYARALPGVSPFSMPGWAFVAVLGALVLLAAYMGRLRRVQ